MIDRELYGDDSHYFVTKELEQKIDGFKVSNDQEEREWEQTENKSKICWIIPTADQSLKTKQKGAGIAYHESI